MGLCSQSRPASKFEARKMEIWPWLNFYKFGTQIFSDEKLRRHRCICGDLRRLWSTNGAGAQTSLRRWGVKDEWAWTSGFGWRDKILQVLSLRFRWRKTLLWRDKTYRVLIFRFWWRNEHILIRKSNKTSAFTYIGIGIGIAAKINYQAFLLYHFLLSLLHTIYSIQLRATYEHKIKTHATKNKGKQLSHDRAYPRPKMSLLISHLSALVLFINSLWLIQLDI